MRHDVSYDAVPGVDLAALSADHRGWMARNAITLSGSTAGHNIFTPKNK